MDDDEITQQALAAQGGDRDAAAAFIRATTTQLRRVLSYLGEPGHVDDLVQDTYLRAFAALPSYRRHSPARLWLLAIARRVAADHVRRAQRRPRTTGFDRWHESGARHAVPGAVGPVVLQRAVADPEPDRREAFVLTRVLCLSHAEAAETCGCAVGTIRSRVFRARSDLIAIPGADDDAPSSISGA